MIHLTFPPLQSLNFFHSFIWWWKLEIFCMCLTRDLYRFWIFVIHNFQFLFLFFLFTSVTVLNYFFFGILITLSSSDSPRIKHSQTCVSFAVAELSRVQMSMNFTILKFMQIIVSIFDVRESLESQNSPLSSIIKIPAN